MFCASCGEATEADPCAVCGRPALLGGRYRLDGVLGRGAQATTWRATRMHDGQAVAIKEIATGPRTDAKVVELFRREARVLRELQHPAIPRYYEDFEASLGRQRTLCLVQELVPGRTLAQEAADRRFTADEVTAIVEELAGIVAWLHSLSPPVLHRDIKPENVVRRPDGRLALVDFGSVRDVVEGTLGGSTVTGTFGYMAPEQLAGDAEPGSDVYALGALAVALLTRRDPRSMLRADGRLDWRRFADVSADTAEFLDLMLSPHPGDRPRSDDIVLPRVTLAERPPIVDADIPEPPAIVPLRGLSAVRDYVYVGVLSTLVLAFLAGACLVMFTWGVGMTAAATDAVPSRDRSAIVHASGRSQGDVLLQRGSVRAPAIGRVPPGDWMVLVASDGAAVPVGTLEIGPDAIVGLRCDGPECVLDDESVNVRWR